MDPCTCISHTCLSILLYCIVYLFPCISIRTFVTRLLQSLLLKYSSYLFIFISTCVKWLLTSLLLKYSSYLFIFIRTSVKWLLKSLLLNYSSYLFISIRTSVKWLLKSLLLKYSSCSSPVTCTPPPPTWRVRGTSGARIWRLPMTINTMKKSQSLGW